MPWSRQATLGCLWLGVLLVTAIKLPKDEPAVNPEICVRQISSARQEATALLAVMTAPGPEGAERRKRARDTWFPATQQEMERLFQDTGIIMRFAVGKGSHGDARDLASEEAKFGDFIHLPVKDTGIILRFAVGKGSHGDARDLATEEAKFGDFIHLPVKATANSDSYMVVALWELAAQHYKAKYVIKAEDESYIRMDRLVQAVSQWDRLGAGYIGCMQQRDDGRALKLMPSDPEYDPHRLIYDGDSTYNADASFVAVEGKVIDGLFRSGLSIRAGGRTDVMIGWVMKAYNVSHFDDRRVCYTGQCDDRMVVYHWGQAIRNAGARSSSNPDEADASVCCPTPEHCAPTNPRAQLAGPRCLEQLHGGDPACATPTLGLNNELDLILDVDRHQHMRSDWEWISAHPVSVMQSLDNN